MILTLAAPAAATAAEVTPTPNACLRYIKVYTNAQPVPSFGLTTTGWAPNSALTFRLGDRQLGTGQADANGNYTAPSPFVPPAPRKGRNLVSTTLTVGDAAGTVTQRPVKVVRLTVSVPNRARPSKVVKYRAFGFSPRRNIYLFVRRGNKTKGRFKLGKPKGQCGTLTRKLRYMPLKTFRTGVYDYVYTQSKRYSPAEILSVYSIDITRTR